LKKKYIFQIVGIIVSIFFLYLTFKGTNFKEIYEALLGLNIWFVLSMFLMSIVFMAAKTLRWKMFLDKFDRVPYKTLFYVNMAAHMFNIIFPLRAGEVLQVFLTKTHTHTRKSQITGTIILNKFFELFSILILFYILTVFVDVPSAWVKPVRYLVVFVLLFLLLFTFNIIDVKKIKEPTGKLMKSMHHFFLSLKLIEDKVLLLKSLIFSLFIWFIELVMIYLLLHAFNIMLPPWVPVFLIVGINLAILIPATSGSFGTYEFSIVLMLTLFGVSKELAVSFGLALHFLEIVPVMIVGTICYFKIKH